jgi:hypothetical protein
MWFLGAAQKVRGENPTRVPLLHAAENTGSSWGLHTSSSGHAGDRRNQERLAVSNWATGPAAGKLLLPLELKGGKERGQGHG